MLGMEGGLVGSTDGSMNFDAEDFVPSYPPEQLVTFQDLFGRINSNLNFIYNEILQDPNFPASRVGKDIAIGSLRGLFNAIKSL